MRVCEVIGNVVASAHHPAYDGHKVMVVQPLDPTGKPVGASLVALDRVQAGVGDRVLVMAEGNGVRQLLGKDVGPIQVLIVGIVDEVEFRSASSLPVETAHRGSASLSPIEAAQGAVCQS